MADVTWKRKLYNVNRGDTLLVSIPIELKEKHDLDSNSIVEIDEIQDEETGRSGIVAWITGEKSISDDNTKEEVEGEEEEK